MTTPSSTADDAAPKGLPPGVLRYGIPAAALLVLVLLLSLLFGGAPSQTVDSLRFEEAPAQHLNTTVTSAPVTVVGFEGSLPLSISGADGATYALNSSADGDFTDQAGQISSGDTLRLRVTTGQDYADSARVRVSIGDNATTWTARTVEQPNPLLRVTTLDNGTMVPDQLGSGSIILTILVRFWPVWLALAVVFGFSFTAQKKLGLYGRLFGSWVGSIGLFIVLFWAFTALFAPLIAPYQANEPLFIETAAPGAQMITSPEELSEEALEAAFYGPGEELFFLEEAGLADLSGDEPVLLLKAEPFLLGTDERGNDLFSRVVWGSQFVLVIAPAATLIAFCVGIMLGLPAGYFGGRLDSILSFLANLVLAFPVILLFYLLVTPGIRETALPYVMAGIFFFFPIALTSLVLTSRYAQREIQVMQVLAALGIGVLFFALVAWISGFYEELMVVICLGLLVAMMAAFAILGAQSTRGRFLQIALVIVAGVGLFLYYNLVVGYQLNTYVNTLAGQGDGSDSGFLVTLARVFSIAYMEPNQLNIFAAVVFASSPGVFRIVRGLTMDIKTRDYVAAALTRGERSWYVMLWEILPNARGPLIVDACLRIGYTTILLGTLGFFGLGLSPESPDWGSMIDQNRGIFRSFPYLIIPQTLALASLVLGLNLLADGLREQSLKD